MCSFSTIPSQRSHTQVHSQMWPSNSGTSLASPTSTWPTRCSCRHQLCTSWSLIFAFTEKDSHGWKRGSQTYRCVALSCTPGFCSFHIILVSHQHTLTHGKTCVGKLERSRKQRDNNEGSALFCEDDIINRWPSTGTCSWLRGAAGGHFPGLPDWRWCKAHKGLGRAGPADVPPLCWLPKHTWRVLCVLPDWQRHRCPEGDDLLPCTEDGGERFAVDKTKEGQGYWQTGECALWWRNCSQFAFKCQRTPQMIQYFTGFLFLLTSVSIPDCGCDKRIKEWHSHTLYFIYIYYISLGLPGRYSVLVPQRGRLYQILRVLTSSMICRRHSGPYFCWQSTVT